jgi:two-component system NarL family response regulator
VALAIGARLDRECLATSLAAHPDLRVVGRVGTREQAVALCARRRPRVLILDPLLGCPWGSMGVSDLLAASPRTRILVLAPHAADRCAMLNPRREPLAGGTRALDEPLECASQALREGAHGVLRRDCGVGELARAVRALAVGDRWIGSDVSLRKPDGVSLSPRELQVARLVGQGCSNKDIAAALRISGLTVKKHVTQILRKLGLEDRLQLGLCVARHSSWFADPAPIP